MIANQLLKTLLDMILAQYRQQFIQLTDEQFSLVFAVLFDAAAGAVAGLVATGQFKIDEHTRTIVNQTVLGALRDLGIAQEF